MLPEKPATHQALLRCFVEAQARLIHEFVCAANEPRKELVAWANQYAADHDLQPIDREIIAPYEGYWQDQDDIDSW
jgi:hypothetical protein